MTSDHRLDDFLGSQQTKEPRVPLEFTKAIWRSDNHKPTFGQMLYCRVQEFTRIVNVFHTSERMTTSKAPSLSSLTDVFRIEPNQCPEPFRGHGHRLRVRINAGDRHTMTRRAGQAVIHFRSPRPIRAERREIVQERLRALRATRIEGACDNPKDSLFLRPHSLRGAPVKTRAGHPSQRAKIVTPPKKNLAQPSLRLTTEINGYEREDERVGQ